MSSHPVIVRIQLGDSPATVLGTVYLDEADTYPDAVAYVVGLLRSVADEYEAQVRYSQHERD